MKTVVAQPVEADRLPRGLVDLYQRYAFTSVDPRGAYAYDTLEEWRTVTEHAANMLADALVRIRATDSRLYSAELEWLEKLGVCWRVHGLGAATKWEPQTTYNAEQAAALRGEMRALGNRLARRIASLSKEEAKAIYDEGPIPIAHGKGSPHWYNANDRHAAVSLAAIAERCRNFDELEYRMTHVAETRMPLCLVSYTRIQSNRKEMTNYILLANLLQAQGTRLGPKVRTIQALPFPLNYLAAGVGNVLKWAMQSETGMSGNITEALELARGFQTALATDLATYDDTVSYETDAAWAVDIYEPCLAAMQQLGLVHSQRVRLLMEIEDHVRVMPLLCPPRDITLGAELWPTAGRIKSGKRMTSIEGTTINHSRIRAKMARHGISGVPVNWGDDTLLLTNDSGSKLRAFIDDTEYGGFKETPADDSAFLMKRVPQGYGYLGRMILGTIDREVKAEPDHILTAALGIATRRAILAGHPLADVYDRWLRETPRRSLRLAHTVAISSDYRNLMRAVASLAERRGTNWDAMWEIINRAEQAGLITTLDALAAREIAQKVAMANEPPYGIFKRDALELPILAAERYLREHAYTTEQSRRAA